MTVVLEALAEAVLGVVIILGLYLYGSGWLQRNFRPRRCQFCCTMIGKWAAFFGVLNCKWCANKMAMGWPPYVNHRDCP